MMYKKVAFPFFFLLNCWISVVALVVLTQLCNLHFHYFFFPLPFPFPPTTMIMRSLFSITMCCDDFHGEEKSCIIRGRVLALCLLFCT